MNSGHGSTKMLSYKGPIEQSTRYKVGYFYHFTCTKKISLPLVLVVAEKVVWEDLSLEYQYESVDNKQATKLDIFHN